MKTFNKQLDAGSYDESARLYHKTILKLSPPLAQHICELAGVKAGSHILSAGTGTGIAAHRAAEIAGETGSVLGVDLSEGMIKMAKQAYGATPGLEFAVMDAENLPFEDASFDAIISLCAILHFPHLMPFVDKMYRLIKPGGRLVVSYGHPRPITLYKLFPYALHRLQRVLQNPWKPHLRAPAFMLDLVAQYQLPEPDQSLLLTEWSLNNPNQKIIEALRGTGFRDVHMSWAGHEVLFDSSEEYWEAQSTIVTLARKRLEIASPEVVEQVHAEFVRIAQSVLDRGGVLTYPYGAIYFVGTR